MIVTHYLSDREATLYFFSKVLTNEIDENICSILLLIRSIVSDIDVIDLAKLDKNGLFEDKSYEKTDGSCEPMEFTETIDVLPVLKKSIELLPTLNNYSMKELATLIDTL